MDITLNEVCGVLHLATGITMVVAAIPGIFENTGVVTLYISKPSDFNSGLEYEEIWSPSVYALLASFSLITALFHFIYYYKGSNDSLRFIEYSLSASIMAGIIGILVGIYSIYELLLIIGLTSSTMLFGFLEETTPENSPIHPFYYGFIPYIFMWTIVSWQFIRSALVLNVPTFVWAIFFCEVVLFSSFAVVQWYYKVNNNDNGGKSSMWYDVLSLTSKMILVWVSFFGLLGRT